MQNQPPPPSVPAVRAGRVFLALGILALVGSFLFAQIDFYRRHQPNMDPVKYWRPQLLNIWLPGLAAAAVFLGLAFVLERRRPRD